VVSDEINLHPLIISSIEKLEKYYGMSFCVVLLTPDDKGGLVGGDQKYRARENVIFELEYFMSKLGRKNVCVLCNQSVQLRSDYQ
jgi:predicted nucleotide-binding protein